MENSNHTTERPVVGLRERKKQHTRERIAAVALELFLAHGFEAVTIADVALHADVDAKTIYNYFAGKPDLVYHRLDDWKDSLLTTVAGRPAGEPVLAAFSRFLLAQQGFLGDEAATARLRAVTTMIVRSPSLLAHEDRVYAGFIAALAELLAAETRAQPGDVRPSVVAHALIGLHRSLVAYVRAGTLAGVPNATLRRGVRSQARQALFTLEHGLGDYGVTIARPT